MLSSVSPINYRSSSVPTPSKSNHSSALRFPDAINSFIAAEISHRATAGPFLHNPFPSPLQTSPLQTVRKDDCKRRVVLDLSFPPGASVNDGIPKDSYLDEPFIFLFLAPPTSPISSSPRAQDVSFLRRI